MIMAIDTRRAEFAAVRVAMARRAVPRKAQERMAEIAQFDFSARGLRNLLRIMTTVAGKFGMRAFERVSSLRPVIEFSAVESD